MTNSKPKRGEIWLVSFEPQVGAEIMKTRPAVILTVTVYSNTPFRVVVPIRDYKEFHDKASHLILLEPEQENGLSKKSSVDCLQVKSFAMERFIHKLGKVTADELNEITVAVGMSIGCFPI